MSLDMAAKLAIPLHFPDTGRLDTNLSALLSLGAKLRLRTPQIVGSAC
jgi:hypothetical protein